MQGANVAGFSLLVRLKDMGPVLLTGNLVDFRDNYENGGVPSFNVDRAATVASIERMKQIVANLKATVVIHTTCATSASCRRSRPPRSSTEPGRCGASSSVPVP
jgi:hypothetical protein